MKWSEELYISEEMKESAEEVRKHMENGDFSDNVLLITLATNRKNQLDIIHSLFLRERFIRSGLPLIVGIAKSRKNAYKLVADIMNDTLRETGGADMRTYLGQKQFTQD